MKQIIGVTGGIGCGKSQLTNYFAELGYPVIDTDQVAKDIVKPAQPGLVAMIQLLGADYLLPTGELDRAKLRATFFDNPELKQNVEAILHPIIRQTVKQQVETLRADNRLIFIAIPVVNQLNQPEYQLDYVLLVECDQELQIERVKQRDKRTEQQIQQIIANQASRAERQAIADFIIENNGSQQQLKQQADNWLQIILKDE